MAPKFTQNRVPFARETLTVSNSVKVLTPSVYNDGAPRAFNQYGAKNRHATAALITVETGGATTGVRYTQDGTTPVAATTGNLAVNGGTTIAPSGSYREISLDTYGAICNFQAIRDQAGDTIIQVEYYR